MQNKILFSIVVASLFLVGCDTTPKVPVIKTVIQRVEVPIPIPCKADIPELPDFNFDKLTENDTLFDKSKSLLADRQLHLSYEEELLAALKSCK